MIINILAGIVSGMLGAMGFGGGGILILYLTLCRNISQINAQGINLLFFIPSATLAIIFHIKNKLIDKRTALQYIGFGLIGVVLGFLLLEKLNDDILRIFFAIILIIVGLKDLFFKK